MSENFIDYNRNTNDFVFVGLYDAFSLSEKDFHLLSILSDASCFVFVFVFCFFTFDLSCLTRLIGCFVLNLPSFEF